MSHLLLRHFPNWLLDTIDQLNNEYWLTKYDKFSIMKWWFVYYVKGVIFNE